jgi:hypothetical protein
MLKNGEPVERVPQEREEAANHVALLKLKRRSSEVESDVLSKDSEKEGRSPRKSLVEI